MNNIDLKNTPRPHYLKSGEVEVRKDRLLFNGKVVFPLNNKNDPSLIDRDHVNVTHMLYSIWNVAHYAVKSGFLYPNMRVLSQSGNYFLEPTFDTEISIFVELEFLRSDDVSMKACLDASFRYQNELLSKNHIVFIATKK